VRVMEAAAESIARDSMVVRVGFPTD